MNTTRVRGRFGAATAFFVAMALGVAYVPTDGAMAQGVSAQASPELRADYDAAFQRMLRDPGNLDVIFDFARAAVQAGDYEGAIGAYERMLVYNPELPTVRYELGRLYFLLGSYSFADYYFASALERQLPPEVRVDVERYRADIDRRLSQNQWSGSVTAGTRYQSNVNAAPSVIRVLGITGTLDPGFREQSDESAFCGGCNPRL